jgi:hypothetical protein
MPYEKRLFGASLRSQKKSSRCLWGIMVVLGNKNYLDLELLVAYLAIILIWVILRLSAAVSATLVASFLGRRFFAKLVFTGRKHAAPFLQRVEANSF